MPGENLTCRFCGSDPRGMFADYPGGLVSRCSEHDSIICNVCGICNSLEPTEAILARATQMRAIYEDFIAPYLKKLRNNKER